MRCGLEARLYGRSGCAQEPAVCRPRDTKAADAKGVSHSLITFDGGDGASTDTPVTIKGARDIREGLLAQMLWIGKTYWGWRRHDRQLAKDKDRVLDRVEFTTPQGEKRTVYFDISEFHDKH
jgi:hypothetical protein